MLQTIPRQGRARWLLVALGIGVFFGTLDQTVVVTILPSIIRDIRLPIDKLGQASWVVNGYLVGYTVSMPIVGRIADIAGRIRIFLACLVVFVVGSCLVALAPNLPALVAARTFQAVGGGGLLPVALAIAADATSSRRTLAFGALAAANNGSTFLGPVWGAAIAGVWDWRAIFWLNVPLVAALFVLMPLLARDGQRSAARSVDWLGAALLALGLAAVTFGLTDDGVSPRPLWLSALFVLGGLFALGAFVRRELHSERPMIELRVLRLRAVAAASATYLLIGGALITALVVVPLMSDVLYGESTTQGGLTLMRLLLLLPIGGLLGGWIATRAGNRTTVLAGIACALAGFIWMRLWPYHPGALVAAAPPSWQLWGALGAIGFGLGLCDGPIVATVVDAVKESERATAAAMLLVLWSTGMITGLAVLATQGLGAFGRRIAVINLDNPEYQVRFEGALHRTFDETFVAAAVVLGLAFAAALALRSGRAAGVHVSAYDALGGNG